MVLNIVCGMVYANRCAREGAPVLHFMGVAMLIHFLSFAAIRWFT